MPVTLYQSTDPSAPVLTGSPGSLIALLDACLVTGYGTKTAAGWSKAFSGTNLASYRQGAGCSMYLRIDDSGPGAAGAREARAVGYETMTDINTGLHFFPPADDTTSPNGVWMRKSSTLDTTARAWWLAADAKRFHLLVDPADTAYAPNTATGAFFGDIVSFKGGGDGYCCTLIGRSLENAASNLAVDCYSQVSHTVANILYGHYMARTHSGLGSCVRVTKVGNASLAGYGGSFSYAPIGYGYSQLTTPNPTDGGMYMVPVLIGEINTVRGKMPGLWCPCQPHPFNHLDTFSGAGDMAGKSFLALNTPGGGQIILETSDTWGG